MNDTPQAHLVVLVAGACLSAAVLAVAGGQAAEAGRAQARDATDALAAAIGLSGCSASTPEVLIDLQGTRDVWAGGVREATLLPDRIRIELQGGGTFSSVAFRPVGTTGPIDLLAPDALVLAYDPLEGSCVAWPAPVDSA